MRRKLNIGLDLHGVIDADPETFSELTHTLKLCGHSIFIITGQEDSPELRKYLDELDIAYTTILSITTHHKTVGTPVRYRDAQNPFIDFDVWDRTKAELCAIHDIHLHLDDSDIYGKHFRTPYAIYSRNA